MSDNRILATMDDEIGVGRWGREWQRFMTENYPDEAAALKSGERWEQLAIEIEKEAMDLRELLRSQYAKANPRPADDFMEIVKWENTRGFYIDHEIMEQLILQFRA